MTTLLGFLARNGRHCLVAGLLAGLVLQDLAQAMRPYLPTLVTFLLFLAALRVGPRAALGSLADARASLILVLAFQILLPLVAIGGLAAFGQLNTLWATALILVLAGSSVTGGVNFTIMLGHDPAPAMRLLIVGTGLLPLTVLPAFYAMPALGDSLAVAMAALRLLAAIGVAVTVAFLIRHFFVPTFSETARNAIDGGSALMLAVMVIGLMSAVGPALRETPGVALGWLAFAFTVNFALQIATFLGLRRSSGSQDAVPVSIVAGNRNVALFLVALPAETTDPLLIFIGCYQVPMYLTPILLRPLYGRR